MFPNLSPSLKDRLFTISLYGYVISIWLHEEGTDGREGEDRKQEWREGEGVRGRRGGVRNDGG